MEGSLNQKSTAVKSCNILRSSHNTASSIRSREELRDMVTHVVTRECSDTPVLRWQGQPLISLCIFDGEGEKCININQFLISQGSKELRELE